MTVISEKPDNLFVFKLKNLLKKKFECPVCKYKGPFLDKNFPTGLTKHMKCPNCLSTDRHRLQYLVIMDIFKNMDTSKLKMIHFAPEYFFRRIFKDMFGEYETADLNMKNVTHRVDMTNLPFDDCSYDFIMASGILEHIRDDVLAIKELSRILKPNGVAVLYVPVICEKTVEYPEPNSNESGHVRAVGMDYFKRYNCFSRVELIKSESLPEKYQLFSYNDRSIFPNEISPLRPPMYGKRHNHIVPICYKN